jgi:hypothetical protein
LRHGRQIDRVYAALWKEFPPRGKAPTPLSIKAIARKLQPHWEAENEELSLENPSDDVVEAAVNALRARPDD